MKTNSPIPKNKEARLNYTIYNTTLQQNTESLFLSIVINTI